MNQPLTSRPPALQVVSQRFSLGALEHVQKLENGLVNESYLVRTSQGNFVVQALNGNLWDKRVIDDYCAVQHYLRTNELFVPVLLPASDGTYAQTHEGILWRAFEYVPHDSVVSITPALAAEAGSLLGKFHALMARSSFLPSFTLPGFHDTPAIRERLQTTARLPQYAEKAALVTSELDFLGRAIEQHYLPAATPKIVIHGDPKLNNFLFREGKATTLLDLDTMMLGSPLLDLGDAFRSWCRKKPATAEFLPDVFEAAFDGYCRTAPFQYTLQGVKSAVGLITLELATRYLTDYFEESYFAHKSEKYATPAEQNLARSRRYLAYYHQVMGHRTPYVRDE